MSKISDKKSERTKTISDSEILGIYEAIIPLLSNNPEELNIAYQINKQLLTFIQYDFDHYMMDAPTPGNLHGPLDMTFEKWENFGPESDAHFVSIYPSNYEILDEDFEESVERNYRSALARQKIKFPEIPECDYFRIESKTHPRIVIGFFRRKDSTKNNDFTSEEKNVFDQLTPHIVALYRAVLNQVYLSQGFQYFSAFTQLGSKLANDYSLSDTEVKLIPEILFGRTNEEIAERHFISVSTVKSHFNHILKKTGTKNRIDFLAKFFTSPEHVSL
jgi:DNA-binding CsgD family transcriptional regulator